MSSENEKEIGVSQAGVLTLDEVAMMRFLELCVPSLDPDSYQNVLDACRMLCVVRSQLSGESVLICLKQIFGDDYVEPSE